MSVPVTRVLLPAEELEARIGYQFKNKALLKRALTHRSFAAEHNERLEFLGDSVLNCVIGHALFLRDRHFTEGVLSRVRSNLVCEKALDEIAAQIQIGQFIYLGEGELKTGGADRPSILADACEAVFGAVFLDGGFEDIHSTTTPGFSVVSRNMVRGGSAYSVLRFWARPGLVKWGVVFRFDTFLAFWGVCRLHYAL